MTRSPEPARDATVALIGMWMRREEDIPAGALGIPAADIALDATKVACALLMAWAAYMELDPADILEDIGRGVTPEEQAAVQR